MKIHTIRETAFEEIEKAKTQEDVERIRVQYLGRKGIVTALLRSLGDLPLEEKKKYGPEYQALRTDVLDRLKERKEQLVKHQKSNAAFFDVTRPGHKRRVGHLHPLTLVGKQMRDIFARMNFSVVDGPELETEYYNFDALNIPADHPAREMWDTFWIQREKHTKIGEADERLLLRTHTSPVQVRYMESHKPPFQIIVPGKTFRYEASDASHEVNFQQLEGLMVGENISISNFRFIVDEFLKQFLDDGSIEVRFRPSYFPFVEPGVEVDVKLNGEWLEVMGAGMVHPAVFTYAGLDPKKYQGFAFGMGVDRLAMIKYNIPDIRLLYSGDLRFSRQFKL